MHMVEKQGNNKRSMNKYGIIYARETKNTYVLCKCAERVWKYEDKKRSVLIAIIISNQVVVMVMHGLVEYEGPPLGFGCVNAREKAQSSLSRVVLQL